MSAPITSAEALTLATALLDLTILLNDLESFVGLRTVLDHDLLEEVLGAWMRAEEGPFENVKVYSLVFKFARDKRKAEVDNVLYKRAKYQSRIKVIAYQVSNVTTVGDLLRSKFAGLARHLTIKRQLRLDHHIRGGQVTVDAIARVHSC